jgi:hypothetical protein
MASKFNWNQLNQTVRVTGLWNKKNVDWRTILTTSNVAGNSKNTAEERYREAFERLKRDRPNVLPKGTPVSQNNVAKEAGCDPTAFRKARFPSLVAEVQQYVATHQEDAPVSKRQQLLKQRKQNRNTQQKIDDLTLQRDESARLLADATLLIVELTEEISDVRRQLEAFRPSASTIPFPVRNE